MRGQKIICRLRCLSRTLIRSRDCKQFIISCSVDERQLSQLYNSDKTFLNVELCINQTLSIHWIQTICKIAKAPSIALIRILILENIALIILVLLSEPMWWFGGTWNGEWYNYKRFHYCKFVLPSISSLERTAESWDRERLVRPAQRSFTLDPGGSWEAKMAERFGDPRKEVYSICEDI